MWTLLPAALVAVSQGLGAHEHAGHGGAHGMSSMGPVQAEDGSFILPANFHVMAMSPAEYHRAVLRGEFPGVYAIEDYCSNSTLQAATPRWICKPATPAPGSLLVPAFPPNYRTFSNATVRIIKQRTVLTLARALVCHAMSAELAQCHREEHGFAVLLVTLEKTDASSESIELFFATHLEGPMAGHMHPLHFGDFVSALAPTD